MGSLFIWYEWGLWSKGTRIILYHTWYCPTDDTQVSRLRSKWIFIFYTIKGTIQRPTTYGLRHDATTAKKKSKEKSAYLQDITKMQCVNTDSILRWLREEMDAYFLYTMTTVINESANLANFKCPNGTSLWIHRQRQRNSQESQWCLHTSYETRYEEANNEYVRRMVHTRCYDLYYGQKYVIQEELWEARLRLRLRGAGAYRQVPSTRLSAIVFSIRVLYCPDSWKKVGARNITVRNMEATYEYNKYSGDISVVRKKQDRPQERLVDDCCPRSRLR